MSLDYTNTFVQKGNVAQSFVANATKLIPGSYVWSKSFKFKALHIAVYINTAATTASQTFVLQKSGSDGTFSSPTTLATITIASTDAAGTTLQARVADGSTDIDVAPYRTRLVHVAGSTDATLDYDWQATYSATHV